MTDNESELHTLQRRFQDYLEGKSEDFVKDIVSTDDALAEHRLGAYYNAYRIRLIDCLATDFPGLQKEFGEQDFERMVLDYLAQHPSDKPSVRWLGRHMAEFLAHSEHPEQAFLSELASFEWNQGLCFDAADSKDQFDLNDMTQIDPAAWPDIRLRFHPSLRWLDLHWNVAPYWVALDQGEIPPAKQRSEIPTRWLMWRKAMSPNWRSLEVTEAWAIEAAVSGASFAELCEGLLEWLGEESVAMSAAGFLKQWIHDGLITDALTAPEQVNRA